MTSTAQVNPKLLGLHLAQSSKARAALDWGVERLKSDAEEKTPETTGYARRHYRTLKVNGRVRRLINTDDFFHLVEFGSANNPPYAPMRRAARALGFRFMEKPK